jgi:hypothetical protein
MARGLQFSAFVSSKFGKTVNASSSSLEAFSMLVAFGRCRFRLDDASVAKTLCDILGGSADDFDVCSIEDRIYHFSVSCKKIGFEIYKIRSFKCLEFELFFQLFNDSGLSFARMHISCLPVFPWEKVSNRRSFAAVVTGANAIPVSDNASRLLKEHVLSARKSVFERLQFPSKAPRVAPRSRNLKLPVRKSVFERLQFPKSSVFDRLNWDRNQQNSQPIDLNLCADFGSVLDCSRESQLLENGSSENSFRQSVHQQQLSAPPSSDQNLDLDLKLGQPAVCSAISNAQAPIVPPSSPSNEPCRRRFSSLRPRAACNKNKCAEYLGWGHGAVSCSENWMARFSNVNLEKLDNFGRDFGSDLNWSSWFKLESLAEGSSNPPCLLGFHGGDNCVPTHRRVTHIFWSLQQLSQANVLVGALPENPNSSSSPPSELGAECLQMAYVRANPATFIPRGFDCLQVQNRRPMEREVLMRPRTQNLDLAIVSIHPMPPVAGIFPCDQRCCY